MSVTLPTIFTYQKASPFCSQYTAVYNAMTNKPSETHAGYQNTLVKGLVDSGYWTNRMDLFYVFANHSNTSTEAYINWASPGTYNLTDPGSTAPVWAQYQGITGSSDYLDTNFAPTDSTYSSINSATIGVYVRTNSSSGVPMGVACNVSGSLVRSAIKPRAYATTMQGYINTAGVLTEYASLTTGHVGAYFVSRTASNANALYHNGTQVVTSTAVSNYLANDHLYVLAQNASYGSTIDNYYNSQVAIVFYMNGIDSTEADAIYDILQAYMTSLGTQV